MSKISGDINQEMMFGGETGRLQKEIASLREQLSNMMHLVASVERERDDLQELLTEAYADADDVLRPQLTAMTKERDDALNAVNDCPDCKILNRGYSASQTRNIELKAQLSAMTKERDVLLRKVEYWRDIAKASDSPVQPATEALLATYRAALESSVEICFSSYSHAEVMKNPEHFINRVLAIPSPQAALNNAIAEELERMAENGDCREYWIRNRAKELREMK